MKHLEYLQHAAKQGKLAHAYLFSGNDGTAKERLVKELLEFLLGPLSAKPHPDVVLVSPENNEITIGQVRRLKEQLALSCWQGPWKVAVLRKAERMNQEAQSAFLKLLEEPRGNTILIMLTEHPALLFQTIRSRAQELRMYAFPEPALPNAGLLSKLKGAPLADRFAFAAKAAEDPAELQKTLLGLLCELRLEFLAEAGQGKVALASSLRSFQEVLYQLRSTNVNPRLAAERIFLEL
ncbi:MAG: hypothetical protein Q8P12_02375 [bacterium]|nr:hypothetical protein [bacterium]